jgi:hypothetical protein
MKNPHDSETLAKAIYEAEVAAKFCAEMGAARLSMSKSYKAFVKVGSVAMDFVDWGRKQLAKMESDECG